MRRSSGVGGFGPQTFGVSCPVAGPGAGSGTSTSGPSTSRQTAGLPPLVSEASSPSCSRHHSTISVGVARSSGAEARHRASSGCSRSGSRDRSGAECTIRNSTVMEGPVPYSGSPSAAYAAV